MPKRLALTIAGAVSLGSYEAGVMYEVLDAIRQHNTDPRTTPDQQIKVDVLTGASAGGMTAIILAQKLLFSANEFAGPYDNPLYNTWVLGIDLKGLQDTQPDEPALDSLFSSDLVESISRTALLTRYAAEPLPPPPGQRHPASAAAIRVGVALTNLNGVDYGYPVEPDGSFVYTKFNDQLTRLADSTNDNSTFWEPLRQAAVACGAFPIAFRPQDMSRSAIKEPLDYPSDNLIAWPHDPRFFTYSDGGILQNQPLGMAKNLVDLIDNHQDQDSRFYLFVSPHAKNSDANDNFTAASADYLRLISRLIKVVIGQSGFEDWITAKGVNQKVVLLDSQATALANSLGAHGIAPVVDPATLRTAAQSLLGLLFPEGQQFAPGAIEPETLPDARTRIAQQYSTEIASLTPAAAEAFRDTILTFESAAGLGARDLMRIYGITATSDELAGADLEAFLGFFDQTFRDHDYDVGRTHARTVLFDPFLNNPGEMGPIRFTPPNDIRPIDSRLDGLKIGNAPSADLDEFRTGMKNRVNQMLLEWLHGKLLTDAAKLVVDPILHTVLDKVIDRL